ncbi:MAG: hypothetical protein LUH82_04340 [Clostridiales bacterium]|nr:hypothetical protein [Clostridiales bacterium]
MKIKEKKQLSKGKIAASVISAFLAAFIAVIAISCCWRSNPGNIKQYDVDNQYITALGEIQISAHRSGGGIMPEETMMAFKNCAENSSFEVDTFEFDLHITKDNVLVLLHDDTLERTSDCEEVLGVADAKPSDYTYDELRQLNMGAKFENESGDMPYAGLSGADVPDELKILRVEDALDYLMSVGDYNYIIEIKDSGTAGQQGVDILYDILVERNLLGSVIFGTFHEEVSQYADENHPDLVRSATIKEVLSFWAAAMRGDSDFEAAYSVLQIPYNLPYRLLVNLGTAKVINYAHEHNIAVQYWTVNNESDMEYLYSLGADCIMTDYPDALYKVVYAQGD